MYRHTIFCRSSAGCSTPQLSDKTLQKEVADRYHKEHGAVASDTEGLDGARALPHAPAPNGPTTGCPSVTVTPTGPARAFIFALETAVCKNSHRRTMQQHQQSPSYSSVRILIQTAFCKEKINARGLGFSVARAHRQQACGSTAVLLPLNPLPSTQA